MQLPHVRRSTAFLSALTQMGIVKLTSRNSWYALVLVCVRPARVYLPLHPPHLVSLYMSLGACALLRTVQIEGIFARADADGSTEIDYEEFMVSGTRACCCSLTTREDRVAVRSKQWRRDDLCVRMTRPYAESTLYAHVHTRPPPRT